MDLLFHILLWVVIIVAANLVLRVILNHGWKALLGPFQRAMPKRSVENDRQLWDHLDDD
jgi:hypothetical protein